MTRTEFLQLKETNTDLTRYIYQINKDFFITNSNLYQGYVQMDLITDLITIINKLQQNDYDFFLNTSLLIRVNGTHLIKDADYRKQVITAFGNPISETSLYLLINLH